MSHSNFTTALNNPVVLTVAYCLLVMDSKILSHFLIAVSHNAHQCLLPALLVEGQ